MDHSVLQMAAHPLILFLRIHSSVSIPSSPSTFMCKTRMAVDAAQPGSPSRTSRSRPSKSPRATGSSRPAAAASASASTSYSSEPSTSTAASGSANKLSSGTSSVSSRASLSSFRATLPENPHIYDFSEISSVTNNFLAKRYSSSSSTPSWRCTLRGKDVIVFQRKFRRKSESSHLKERLAVICRSHHGSIVKLLGASISGEHIYLVYEFINGANLADCLRNSRNPNFTVLSTWISRMQIATDLAHGLDYIHNSTGLNVRFVHNYIKSSSIVVTEPSFNAKVCHFGAAQLCGEADNDGSAAMASISEYTGEINDDSRAKELKRSGRGKTQFEGVKGYMSPEFQSTGESTQMSDVYAFGVVILELLSGEEPMKYKFDKNRGDFVRTSVIDTARAAMDAISGEASTAVDGRLRRWIDRKLNDSFPVDVAAKLTRLALECVSVDPTNRPNMARVAGKISKLYLQSQIWSENMKIPTSMTVSFAPR